MSDQTGKDNHCPVLLDEALAALRIEAQGKYVDCTFGRGGHSRAIAAQLSSAGRLLVLDRDPQAIAVAHAWANSMDGRVLVRQTAFDQLADIIATLGWTGQVAGVLLDLGVSSPQVEDPTRGFSFQQDGPLDMRMDPGEGQPAWAWLDNVAEEELANVLYHYGEERHSRRIARAIVQTRAQAPVRTTRQLAGIVARAQPHVDSHKHPATRTFQAIRIYINRELECLSHALPQAVDMLQEKGRIAIISFHSLEDRIVKQFLRDHSQPLDQRLPPGLPVRPDTTPPLLQRIGKAMKPSEEEIAANPRARSAVLRVAEKNLR